MRIGSLTRVAALCVVAFSCLTSAFAAPPAGDPIKIGAIFGVTGPAAYLGAPEEKTARMVVDSINRDGGILGRQVQLPFHSAQEFDSHYTRGRRLRRADGIGGALWAAITPMLNMPDQ